MVTTTLVFWITTQDHGGDVTMTQFHNSDFFRILFTVNHQIKMYTRRGLGGYYEMIGWYFFNVIQKKLIIFIT